MYTDLFYVSDERQATQNEWKVKANPVGADLNEWRALDQRCTDLGTNLFQSNSVKFPVGRNVWVSILINCAFVTCLCV